MNLLRHLRSHRRRVSRFHSVSMTLAALCLAAAPGCAQVSFTSAIDLAMRGDPKIKSAQAGVDKARAAAAATRDAFIPSASASGGYGASTGVPLGVPVVFGLASQSLLFNFSQKDNERAAELALEAATLSLKEARDQVAEDVAVTYLNLNYSQQRKAAMAQEFGFATRLVAIVRDRLDAGQDSQVELLRARRTAAQIHLQQLQIEDETAALSDHLARLIGLPGNKLSAVQDSIPALPPVDSLSSDDGSDSFGVQAAMEGAKSKQRIAFGEARYRFRPQVSFGANYSRISTSHTDYVEYYPGFKSQPRNAASIGIEIRVPLYDRGHQDQAQEAAADARQALFDAQSQRSLFLEGRAKLRHSASQLAARIELAEIDRDLAHEQLEAVLVQLTAGSGDPNAPPLTPKDEQNARLQERARTIDLLDAQFQLSQAQVALMRQTGQLDAWLNAAGFQSGSTSLVPQSK